MKVFLHVYDLFQEVGGGQTFFRSAIQTNPAIDFFYLSKKENPHSMRPANAFAIPLEQGYPELGTKEAASAFHSVPSWAIYQVSQAANIAFTLRGREFDVIDLPDWEQLGCFLPFFLQHFGVKWKTISLSMHGTITSSLSRNWDTSGLDFLALRQMEITQYFSSNVRYGISESYIEDWESQTQIRPSYLHPFSFLSFPQAQPSSPGQGIPDLVFFGRTEKRKGPDFFINAAWALPKSKFRKGYIIGPSCQLENQITSREPLQSLIDRRNIDIQILDGISQTEMRGYFVSQSLCVLPSRYDTFNLVALESLMAGCPVVVGENCGVVGFVRKELPDFPLYSLPMDDFSQCLKILEQAIDSHDKDRLKLYQTLSNHTPTGIKLNNLVPMYEKTSTAQKLPWFFGDIVKTFLNNCPEPKARPFNASTNGHPKGMTRTANILETVKRMGKSRYTKNFNKWEQPFVTAVTFLPRLARKYLRKRGVKDFYHQLVVHYLGINALPECREKDFKTKVDAFWEFMHNSHFGKGFLYGNLARFFFFLDKPLIAATYSLRTNRLSGSLSKEQRDFVVQTLLTGGFPNEAKCVPYFSPKTEQKEIANYLQIKRNSLLAKPKYATHYEITDDRRKKPAYKVSIIVSLYNAGNKLRFFLEQLSRQTILQNGQTELILVDSSSPTNEREIYLAQIDSHNIDSLYCRTDERETIQKAWNRGISLARGAYLVFLGVDEGLTPEALEILAGELDHNPGLDWVQGNSLVTNVSSNGSWVEDVMLYERSGFHPFHIYLETCYISWVGAMYRKSIHDRFGYYDDSFRAAGDTEFKCRIGPFIQMKTLPKTLGIFWNHPEERTTQSPLAELEDLRAWYLFRTPEGMEYALQGKDQDFIQQALLLCLKYRKSYSSKFSTDIILASAVAGVLQNRFPQSRLTPLHGVLEKLRQTFENFDREDFSSSNNLLELRAEFSRNRKPLIALLAALGLKDYANFHIKNDNRYEQHNMLWK